MNFHVLLGVVRFANGETIISQGEKGDSCYIVIKGRVV